MKDLGSFIITVGAMYAFWTLTGHTPNFDLWWLYVIVGATIYYLGHRAEQARKREREERTTRIMRELIERNEQWRKERGL